MSEERKIEKFGDLILLRFWEEKTPGQAPTVVYHIGKKETIKEFFSVQEIG